jgi:hypothetical protein
VGVLALLRAAAKELFSGDRRTRNPKLEQARKVACRSTIPAIETVKPGRPGKKWGKIHWALDAGGWGVVIITAIASLNQFHAQPIWEMSVKISSAPA